MTAISLIQKTQEKFMINDRSKVLSHTHSGSEKPSCSEIKEQMENIKTRLSQQFNSEPEKLAALLKMLDELSEFELGRFLIKNKGALSGYWTWYCILGFNSSQITSPLERFFLEKAPAILATRERFSIFQNLLIKNIRANSVVCSIPCGMMADLLTLKLPDTIKELRFVGIDLDETVFQLAKDLAKELGCTVPCKFFQQNAWDLEFKNEFDLITTNGLNIYEKDDSRVVALYRGLYQALKAGGKLICSALTPPPQLTEQCEWDFSKIDKANLEVSATLFRIVLEATWSNFRTSEKTCAQLAEAGFEKIEIFWDSRKMFPTFSAQKPNLLQSSM